MCARAERPRTDNGQVAVEFVVSHRAVPRTPRPDPEPVAPVPNNKKCAQQPRMSVPSGTCLEMRVPLPISSANARQGHCHHHMWVNLCGVCRRFTTQAQWLRTRAREQKRDLSSAISIAWLWGSCCECQTCFNFRHATPPFVAQEAKGSAVHGGGTCEHHHLIRYQSQKCQRCGLGLLVPSAAFAGLVATWRASGELSISLAVTVVRFEATPWRAAR